MMRPTLALTVLLAVGAAGCGQLHLVTRHVNPAALAGGVARAGASQLPVDDEEERAYGGAVALQIIARHGGLVEDEALHRYVGLVGLAVASTSARPALAWHFGVLASETPNAWSAPGGYVFITRGLLRLLQDEAELAAVLGHEIGHITRRHAVGIFQNLKSSKALSDATGAWKAPGAFGGLIDGYVEDYLTRGMPRNLEFEADSEAIELAARVGYRVDALPAVLARVKAATPAPAAGASSHPDLDERVARLQPQIAARSAAERAGVALPARLEAEMTRAGLRGAAAAPSADR